ncbi:hypothetical protein BGX20_008145 [Mortierella sp. AD010]|nr:hypothetical protein BGX20_008145 [Mortierella sp. AD010]
MQKQAQEDRKQNQLLLAKLDEIHQTQQAHAAWLQVPPLPQQHPHPHRHPQQQPVEQLQSFYPCHCPVHQNNYPLALVPTPQCSQPFTSNAIIQYIQQQQQQQQQQQWQWLQPPPAIDDYQMLPDQGKLTVMKAWEEFHNEVTQARRKNASWPFTAGRRRLYNRRLEFINLIKREAKEKNQTEESIVEEWMVKYQGQTINSIREAIKKQRASGSGKAIDEDQDQDYQETDSSSAE